MQSKPAQHNPQQPANCTPHLCDDGAGGGRSRQRSRSRALAGGAAATAFLLPVGKRGRGAWLALRLSLVSRSETR